MKELHRLGLPRFVPERNDLVSFLLQPHLAMVTYCRLPAICRSLQAGYSLAELVVTVGMILILTTWAMPSFLNYHRSARIRAGAQAVAAYLSEARQIAIRNNLAVCVARTSENTIQFKTASGTSCTGTVIAPPGLADASNNIRLPENVTLSDDTVVFGSLGNANLGGSYTVTDAISSRTLTVTVAGSGRVSIGP